MRVGRVNGQFIANPTHDERDAERSRSRLRRHRERRHHDRRRREELPEEEFIKALEFAHGHAREMIRIQKELAAQVGKPKREMPLMTVNQEILEVAYQVAGDRIEGALYNEKKVDAQQSGERA